ncbi:MAG TPA: outer membrane beta-barrel family protein [Hymenobacter sp.]
MRHFSLRALMLLVLLLGACWPVAAQINPATLTGQVVDAVSRQPVPYATVTLNQAGKLITGHSTNDQGQYQLAGIAAGSYTLKVGFIGFRDTVQALTIEAGRTYQLPPIALRSAALELDEVVVRGEQTTIANLIDKKVISVGQDLLAGGASAVDILANVPSVQADATGNISLRGNRNVTVLVDGKPSPLPNHELLQQLSAASIDKIEVITAPSAKYTPQGATGIINIITRRGAQAGFNGSAGLGWATGRKYNGNLEANYGRGSWNTYANYSLFQRQFRHFESQRKGLTEKDAEFFQQSRLLFDGDGQTLKAGADYSLSKTSSLSFYTTQSRMRHTLLNRWEFSENAAGTPTARYRRDAENPHDHLTQDYNLSYKKSFTEPDHVLEAEVNLSNNRNQLDGRYWQTYSLGGKRDTLTTENIQYNNRILTLTTDYTRPLANQGKLEIGWQSIVKEATNDYQPGGATASGLLVTDAVNRNRFEYDEQTHALYGVYGNRWQKLSFQTGLRLEQTLVTANQVTTYQRFENNYFNLFPSVHGSYAVGEKQEVKLSYSRRITRPSLWNVNPFTNITNPLSIRQGNPFLRPEYINSLELGYQRGSKLGDVSGTLFYRRRTDIISAVYELVNDRTTVFTFANTGASHSSGLELNGTLRPVKPWNVRSSFTSYWHQVSYQASKRFDGLRSWDFSLQNQVTVSKKLSLDLLWKYEGPAVDLQQLTRARQKIDLGLRLKCLRDQGTVSLRATDVLDTYEFRTTELGNGFVGQNLWDGETRIGYVTFSYNWNTGRQLERKTRKQRTYNERGASE